MAEPLTREGLALEIFTRLADDKESPVSQAENYATKKQSILSLLEDVLRVIDGDNRPVQS